MMSGGNPNARAGAGNAHRRCAKITENENIVKENVDGMHDDDGAHIKARHIDCVPITAKREESRFSSESFQAAAAGDIPYFKQRN